MGRDTGAASFRDWKRAVDMKLSKRDDDLLYLVNHGERSALEERVLRGKLVQDYFLRTAGNFWLVPRQGSQGSNEGVFFLLRGQGGGLGLGPRLEI